MKYSMKESYEWMIPEFKTAAHSSGRKINIRGKALYADAVSKNMRHYVAEEVKKSARTLVGKPITINHDPTRIVGHVVYADEVDGSLEYVGEVNNREYVNKLHDQFTLNPHQYRDKYGMDPLYGVSVEADYLYNRCPECGEYFTDLDEFNQHMASIHEVKSGFTEPRGIVYSFLSLVEDPELPGVDSTTMELWETAPGMYQLLETVTSTQQKIMEKTNMQKTGIALQSDKHIVFNRSMREQEPRSDVERAKNHFNLSDDEWNALSDAEKQAYIEKLPPRGSAVEQAEPCPEGQHRNEDGECVSDVAEQEQEPCPEGTHRNEQGECVPDESMQEQEECPEGQHRNEAGDCVPDEPIEEQEQEPTPSDQGMTPNCPEGQKRDPITGECVPDEPLIEQDAMPTPTVACPDGMHLDPATKECVPDSLEPVVVEAPQVEAPAAIETLSLGEPCDWPSAGYTSFDDCVAKNSNKGDPAAYCGQIQQELGGEMVESKPVSVDLSAGITEIQRMYEKSQLDHKYQHDDMNAKIKELYTKLDCNNASFTSLRTGINALRKQQQRIAGKVNEVIQSRTTPKPVDLTPLVASLNETREILNKMRIQVLNRMHVLETANIKGLKQIAQSMKRQDALHESFVGMNNELKTLGSTSELSVKELRKQVQSYQSITADMVKTLKEQVSTQGNDYEKFKTVVNDAYEQSKKEHAEKLAEKDAEITALTQKLDTSEEKKLKETESLTTRIDNIEAKVNSMPNYKGVQSNVITEGPPAKKPWKDGD